MSAQRRELLAGQSQCNNFPRRFWNSDKWHEGWGKIYFGSWKQFVPPQFVSLPNSDISYLIWWLLSRSHLVYLERKLLQYRFDDRDADTAREIISAWLIAELYSYYGMYPPYRMRGQVFELGKVESRVVVNKFSKDISNDNETF